MWDVKNRIFMSIMFQKNIKSKDFIIYLCNKCKENEFINAHQMTILGYINDLKVYCEYIDESYKLVDYL